MENEHKLLADWESIFQQGLLTFWVFVILDARQLTVGELMEEIARVTNNTYQTSEQVLYRMLRKQYDLELVDFQETPGNGGPNRKAYTLSPLGKKLLKSFAERNISLFHRSDVKKLFKKGQR